MLKAFLISIAVFGGSLSVFPESGAAKEIWARELDATVIDYGVGGAGFSSLQGHSLQMQVDSAAVHDVYILWASTNDFNRDRACGTPQDYTSADGFNPSRLETQCGGINYCISTLRAKNPSAVILFFTSLPFFSKPQGGYPPTGGANGTGLSFTDYIDAQILCCALQGVPVLDQYRLGIFHEGNFHAFYRPDLLHVRAPGYRILGPIQAAFIAENLPD